MWRHGRCGVPLPTTTVFLRAMFSRDFILPRLFERKSALLFENFEIIPQSFFSHFVDKISMHGSFLHT